MNKKTLYLLAFLIPILGMVLLMILIGIYPFGAKTFLTLDLECQYTAYFSYLKEIFKDPSTLLYGFSKTLGGEMIGFAAYYLISPLNIIYALVPTEQLPNAAMVVTLLKVGLAGLSFFIYTRKSSVRYVMFSTAYALMAYNIVYMSNTIWIDDVILLPLVVLGIEKIIENKKPWLYLGTLFYVLVSNYYIGYMICIFSVIYFMYQWFFVAERKNWTINIVARYALSSALAGGLAAVILLPVKQSLAGQKSGINLDILTMEPNFSLRAFMSKYVLGSFNWEQVRSGLPNIYCGILVLLFVVFFLLGKKYSWKVKIGSMLVLASLFLCMILNGLNVIWHGFNYPIWYPYRYSFLFSFVLLMMAVKGMDSYAALSEERSHQRIILIAGLSLGVYALAVYLIGRGDFEYLNQMKLILSVGIMLLGALVAIIAYRRIKVGGLIFLALILVELCMNGSYCMKELDYTNIAEYQTYVREVEPAVEYVKDNDKSFYRMEKTFLRDFNDAMLFRYHGLSHFSSAETASLREFMGSLGFRNNGNWSYYNTGTTYANDSFLGIKYLLTQDELGSGYRYLESINDINIYENVYALPIGFMADAAILNENSLGDNWYENQNQLWKTLSSNQTENIFVEVEKVKTKPVDVTVSKNEDGSVKYDKDGEQAYIQYSFTVQNENPLFFYLRSDDRKWVTLKINGEDSGGYFTKKNYQIMQLGQFEIGEKVTIRVYLKRDYVKIDEARFFYQDMKVFEDYYHELSAQGLTIEAYKNNHLYGTIESKGDKQYCLLTIPYDQGWHLYVDGERVTPYAGLNELMAFEVEEGTHEIEMLYIPGGLKYGLIISALSAIILGGWIFVSVKMQRSDSGYDNNRNSTVL